MRAPLMPKQTTAAKAPNRACGASCEGNSKITSQGKEDSENVQPKRRMDVGEILTKANLEEQGGESDGGDDDQGDGTVKSSGAGIDDDKASASTSRPEAMTVQRRETLD